MASSICDLRRTLLAAAICLCAWPRPAAGGPLPGTAASAKETAQTKLSEGVGLLKDGRFREALARFEEAHALVPSPLISYDFGLAYLGLADSARALEAFEAFLGEARDAPVDKRRKAERYRDELRARVTRLELDADVGAAELAVDGRSLGRVAFPRRLYLPPGSHEIVARDGGSGARQTATVTGGAGQTVTLSVRLASRLPEVVAPVATVPGAGAVPAQLVVRAPGETLDHPPVDVSSPAPRPAASKSHLRLWALSTAAVGAISLGAGLTFGVMAKSNGDTITDDSVNGRDFMPDVEASGLRNERREALFLTVGAAAIIAGITLYALARHREGGAGLSPGAP